jgi:hypothetical protein
MDDRNLLVAPIVSFWGGNQMKKKNNMYKLSVNQWNPFAG